MSHLAKVNEMYERGLITIEQFASYCHNKVWARHLEEVEKEIGMKFNIKPRGKEMFQ